MKERPIIFSPAMAAKVAAGGKTQTRRVMSPQPELVGSNGGRLMRIVPAGPGYGFDAQYEMDNPRYIQCPYGKPGDRLWVRERLRVIDWEDHFGAFVEYGDEAPLGWTHDVDGVSLEWGKPQHGQSRIIPSIHMPRWASRTTLEITEVRVERVQDISEADAVAEGIEPLSLSADDIADIQISDEPPDMKELARLLGPGSFSSKVEFGMLWDSINGKKPGCSWADSPYVWAISFRRVAV